MRIILPALIGAALCLTHAAQAGDDESKAESAPETPMALLARLVGGQWVTEGQWADGSKLHARGVTEWGFTKNIIVDRTFVTEGGREYQRYETSYAWDPASKKLLASSVRYDGHMSRGYVEQIDADTLLFLDDAATAEEPGSIRQTVRFVDDDTYV